MQITISRTTLENVLAAIVVLTKIDDFCRSDEYIDAVHKAHTFLVTDDELRLFDFLMSSSSFIDKIKN